MGPTKDADKKKAADNSKRPPAKKKPTEDTPVEKRSSRSQQKITATLAASVPRTSVASAPSPAPSNHVPTSIARSPLPSQSRDDSSVVSSIAASPASCVRVRHASSATSSTKRSFTAMNDEQSLIAIHVKPPNPGTNSSEGVILVTMNFADKIIADVMYMKKGTPTKNIFLKATNCVKRKLSAKQNGTIIERMWQGTGYPRTAIVLMLHSGTTEDQVRAYVDQTFKPAVANISSGNTLRESQLPSLRPGQDYIVVDTWTEAMAERADVQFCIASVYGKFGDWLRSDKAHVYQIWKDGEVPLDDIFAFDLNGTHMNEADTVRHNTYLQEVADEEAREAAEAEAANNAAPLADPTNNDENE
jgi:hypothetical protein